MAKCYPSEAYSSEVDGQNVICNNSTLPVSETNANDDGTSSITRPTLLAEY